MEHAMPTVHKGQDLFQVYQELQDDYQSYDVIETKTKRKFPFFWKKEYWVIVRGVPRKKQSFCLTNTEDHRKTIISILENGIKQDESSRPKKKDWKEQQVVKEWSTHLIQEQELQEKWVQGWMEEVAKDIAEKEWEDKEAVDHKIKEELKKAMKKTIEVTGELDFNSIKKIVFVGPTGVGKTTTLAKMAGKFVLGEKRVGIITIDHYRIGAIEQLKIYADRMGVKMMEAKSPQELRDCLDYFEHVEKVDHILIDTIGRSPMDLTLIDGIKEYMDIANPDHVCLVLSSTQKYSDMVQIIKNFESVGISSLVFTKLDETLSYGSIFHALAQSNKPLSFITDGQQVPQDFYVAKEHHIVSKIIQG